MMERLFLDTNIVLDILLERGVFQSALEILQMGEDGKAELCISYLSMANIAYILRKDYSYTSRVITLKQLSSILTILPMDKQQFDASLFLDGPDMEDIFQAQCAVAAGCNVIITHNPKDYNITSGILKDWVCPNVMTPEEYVASDLNRNRLTEAN